ncbi:hypothetical protein AI27_02315 [Sphingomonas sp. BHC-A]|nr:hypothetical protein AI27_02315 [Sphingomonas sp. BHC-A]
MIRAGIIVALRHLVGVERIVVGIITLFLLGQVDPTQDDPEEVDCVRIIKIEPPAVARRRDICCHGRSESFRAIIIIDLVLGIAAAALRSCLSRRRGRCHRFSSALRRLGKYDGGQICQFKKVAILQFDLRKG